MNPEVVMHGRNKRQFACFDRKVKNKIKFRQKLFKIAHLN